MITGINESKTLAKHILSEYKCNLMEESVIQIKSGITINVRVSVKKKKKNSGVQIRLYLESCYM